MIRLSTMIFAAALAFVATVQAAPQPNQSENVNDPSESICKLDPRTFNLNTGPDGLLAALERASDVKATNDTTGPDDAK